MPSYQPPREILIYDEPTTGMDPLATERLS